MSDPKTVGDTVVDSNNYLNPLLRKQQEGVAKMRTALLACTDENAITLRQALQNVTAMRIYHQMTRIVKYTELMDKLENRLYESIEYAIDNGSPSDTATWMTLLNIQERLQRSMIDSHKMLEPYLDVQEFSVVDLLDVQQVDESSETGINIPAQSRDNIRVKAQAILTQLDIVSVE